MKKKRTGLIIVLICLIVIAALAVKLFVIPKSVIPKNYSKAELRQVIMGGVVYYPRDGFPNDAQAEKIVGILEQYKMKQTMESAEDDDYFAPKIYIALRFTDKNGGIFDSRGIWINEDNEAKVITRPFMSMYCRIQNDGQLYEEIMAILNER